MKKEIYDEMMNYFDMACKIMKEDFSELKELEEKPDVIRYKELMKMKEDINSIRNINELIEQCKVKFGFKLEETNNIWVYAYESSCEECERIFYKDLGEEYKNKRVVVYCDLESACKYKYIPYEDKEEFESSNRVIYGNMDMLSFSDRYYDARTNFFKYAILEGQEQAVQKVLTMYKKNI